jgi:heme-degrading monooxygenase HmoA
VIARVWRGRTKAADGDEYLDFLERKGLSGYAATPGHRGVYVLRRADGRTAEFVLLSLWDSLDSVRAFAGDEVERAVYYPEDDRYLLEREPGVAHFEVPLAPRPAAPGVARFLLRREA